MAKTLKYIVICILLIVMLVGIWMFGTAFIYFAASLINHTAYAPLSASMELIITGLLTFGALHTFFRCLRFLRTGVDK